MEVSEEHGEQVLDRAFAGLERQTPDAMTPAVRWIRNPQARWVRLPLGLLCIVASFFWFLPLLGLWFLPLGLLLIAQDVPFLRLPVGKMILWLEDRWIAARTAFWRWQARNQPNPSAELRRHDRNTLVRGELQLDRPRSTGAEDENQRTNDA